MRIRLGTRGSILALAQSELVAKWLRASGHEVDALVIAAAGLDPLGRAARIDQRIDVRVMPPAPGQLLTLGGPLPETLRQLRGEGLPLVLAADVCLGEYTSHGFAIRRS